MFDIFCHKITFVFQDTQVDVSDLIDIAGACKGASTKKQQVEVLTRLLERRRNDILSKKTADEKNKKL